MIFYNLRRKKAVAKLENQYFSLPLVENPAKISHFLFKNFMLGAAEEISEEKFKKEKRYCRFYAS